MLLYYERCEGGEFTALQDGKNPFCAGASTTAEGPSFSL